MWANCNSLLIPMVFFLIAQLSCIVLLWAHNSSFVGRLCLRQLHSIYFSLSLAGRDLAGIQLSRLSLLSVRVHGHTHTSHTHRHFRLKIYSTIWFNILFFACFYLFLLVFVRFCGVVSLEEGISFILVFHQLQYIVAWLEVQLDMRRCRW